MDAAQQSLEALQDIKKMMERSSRFISLSGWSGVAAGSCALAGAWLAYNKIQAAMPQVNRTADGKLYFPEAARQSLTNSLMIIAAAVFLAALLLAFLFTYLRSKKDGVAIWGSSAQRLLWNTILPMVAGGFVILRLLQGSYFGLIAPVCLIFYGLALINGSKYTVGEIKLLGYAQVILGVISLWMPGAGLIFWAIGFGVLHILYGAMMWWNYER